MPKPKPENPPAFPSAPIESATDDRHSQRDGMTLRDYYAAAAMQGILANPASYDERGFWRQEETTVSEQAFGIADDMLRERQK